jgi:hypothetical protein
MLSNAHWIYLALLYEQIITDTWHLFSIIFLACLKTGKCRESKQQPNDATGNHFQLLALII